MCIRDTAAAGVRHGHGQLLRGALHPHADASALRREFHGIIQQIVKHLRHQILIGHSQRVRHIGLKRDALFLHRRQKRRTNLPKLFPDAIARPVRGRALVFKPRQPEQAVRQAGEAAAFPEDGRGVFLPLFFGEAGQLHQLRAGVYGRHRGLDLMGNAGCKIPLQVFHAG